MSSSSCCWASARRQLSRPISDTGPRAHAPQTFFNHLLPSTTTELVD